MSPSPHLACLPANAEAVPQRALLYSCTGALRIAYFGMRYARTQTHYDRQMAVRADLSQMVVKPACGGAQKRWPRKTGAMIVE